MLIKANLYHLQVLIKHVCMNYYLILQMIIKGRISSLDYIHMHKILFVRKQSKCSLSLVNRIKYNMLKARGYFLN